MEFTSVSQGFQNLQGHRLHSPSAQPVKIPGKPHKWKQNTSQPCIQSVPFYLISTASSSHSMDLSFFLQKKPNPNFSKKWKFIFKGRKSQGIKSCCLLMCFDEWLFKATLCFAFILQFQQLPNVACDSFLLLALLWSVCFPSNHLFYFLNFLPYI